MLNFRDIFSFAAQADLEELLNEFDETIAEKQAEIEKEQDLLAQMQVSFRRVLNPHMTRTATFYCTRHGEDPPCLAPVCLSLLESLSWELNL